MTENYFVLARFEDAYSVSFEPMDEEHLVGRVNALDAEQATALQAALTEEAGSVPGSPTVWLLSDTESRKDPGQDLRRRVKYKELRDEISKLSSGDSLSILVRIVEKFAAVLKPPTRWEVYDTKSKRCVVFDSSGTEEWGPVTEDEDWNSAEECWAFSVVSTLYRHAEGCWTLICERWFQLATAPPPIPEASGLTDAEAADWLVRHGFDPPADVADLSKGALFVPGQAGTETESHVVQNAAIDGWFLLYRDSASVRLGYKADSGVPCSEDWHVFDFVEVRVRCKTGGRVRQGYHRLPPATSLLGETSRRVCRRRGVVAIEGAVLETPQGRARIFPSGT
jgi:hypothetical protein